MARLGPPDFYIVTGAILRIFCHAVLSILGVGHAYPETTIENAFLAELNPELIASNLSDEIGIRSRFSILNALYLRQTGNANLLKAPEGSTESATDLAVRACSAALARAGISSEQVGMVVGETSTPSQTIPSEAARVAKRLSRKIPCFDLYAGTCSLALMLDHLSCWKEAKLPEYILVISTNTPTSRINYQVGGEGVYFGDAACALVISNVHRGPLAIKGIEYSNRAAAGSLSSQAEVFKHLSFQTDSFAALVGKERELYHALVRKQAITSEKAVWIPTSPLVREIRRLEQQERIRPENIWYYAEKCGFTMGSVWGVALSEGWESIAPQSTIICTHCDVNNATSSLVMEAA